MLKAALWLDLNGEQLLQEGFWRRGNSGITFAVLGSVTELVEYDGS